MRFLLGFIFGALYTESRVFRIAFLLIVLVMVFGLYQMSKPLGQHRTVAAPVTQTR
jgi:hypothetical protein